jgi:hypothetical protein
MPRTITRVEPDGAPRVPEPVLVELRARVGLGEHAAERGVLALDRGHRIVDDLAVRGPLGVRLDLLPPGVLRHPEDVPGAILVGVLGVGALVDLPLQLAVALLERVGDVLEENEAEDDVLVLGGIQVVPQLVCGLPKRALERKATTAS